VYCRDLGKATIHHTKRHAGGNWEKPVSTVHRGMRARTGKSPYLLYRCMLVGTGKSPYLSYKEACWWELGKSRIYRTKRHAGGNWEKPVSTVQRGMLAGTGKSPYLPYIEVCWWELGKYYLP
jgi:hypothetical protein